MAKKESINPEQWVAAYADYLYAFALKRLQDPELCKDLVQDTFVSAIKNLRNYNGSSSEKTWLTAILKNKITDVFRSKASETPLPGHLSGENNTQPFFEENGHWKDKHAPRIWETEEADPLENEELKQTLERCLEKLPPLWAVVVSMKYLDEEKSDHICKELSLSPSNYWVIIHRAKLSLRACLEKNWLKG
ncbi:sigma-70 family RNA polymerase sigma factor [Pontibacter pamirensis]|uniref:sigma-70 family RNA polymerase sigma factor n=1 Tax=Pontibacter pamirensis TaxID=2562824 RepID=UPI0013898474|nr:sigma-70 family RNA polymerase sigma factor [Pontibacter pamirensis]